MCTAAAIWAKVAGIVYGASRPDAVARAAEHPDATFTWRQIDMRVRDLVRAGHPVIELHEDVCRQDCLRLFRLTGSSRTGTGRAQGPRRKAPAAGGRRVMSSATRGGP